MQWQEREKTTGEVDRTLLQDNALALKMVDMIS